MAGNMKLLETTGDTTASRDFLLAYQRAVLCVLHQDGFLNQAQLDACIRKLEKQPGAGAL